MSSVAGELFRSDLLVRLLGVVLLNHDRAWTARELASRLEATGVSTHRELQRALRTGVVSREAVGRTYLYRAATESPLFEPLRLLLERTVGVEEQIRRALADVPGVEAAFIHGSFAQASTGRPGRDVDLLVLGDVDFHELRRPLRRVERSIGREIDVLAYTRDELAQLGRRGNSFVQGILRGPVRPIVGTIDDLPGAA